MKAVFEYESYRTFLQDYYRSKKKDNPSFSFRYFAKKAGLNSGNHLKVVMDGTRNLTHVTVPKFTKGLALGEWEALYFENLVFFNQSSDATEKNFYLRNMELARAHNTQVLLSRDQYEVLSNWYPLAIKELTLMSGFKLDCRWISAKLGRKITPQQVKEALDLLVRLKLIRINKKTGKIQNLHPTMQTPDVDTSEAIGRFHKNSLTMAIQAVDQQSVEERHLNSLTIALNKKDLPTAFKKSSKFIKEMNSYFMKGKPYDAIYQLSIQLFRMDNDV
jgi:uncharacterized protein (TIGR02147 family)